MSGKDSDSRIYVIEAILRDYIRLARVGGVTTIPMFSVSTVEKTISDLADIDEDLWILEELRNS